MSVTKRDAPDAQIAVVYWQSNSKEFLQADVPRNGRYREDSECKSVITLRKACIVPSGFPSGSSRVRLQPHCVYTSISYDIVRTTSGGANQNDSSETDTHAHATSCHVL